MRWRWDARMLLVATVCMLVVGSAVSRVRSPTPLSVVRQYLRALAMHDAAAVCGTFSPALVAFNASWEAGPRKSCVRRVEYDHFSTDSPGHDVGRIRIVRVTAIGTDAYGTVGVHLVLWYRFECQNAITVIPGCRPHFEQIPDIIYLRSTGDRWLIVKPGQVYENTSLSAAPWLDALWPPGDSVSVRRPAVIGAPPVTCGSGGTAITNSRRVLYPTVGLNSRPIAANKAPWLHITNARFVWLGRDQLCVTIKLAATPVRDSEYSIDLEQPKNGGGITDSYGIDINGTGGLSSRMRDSRDTYPRRQPPCLTGFGFSGDQLTLIVSPPNDVFDLNAPLTLDVDSRSLQPGEPLLRHPLDAGDIVPSFLGLTLHAPDPRQLSRCTTFRAQ